MSSSSASHDELEPNHKAFSKILLFMRDLNDAFGNEFKDLRKYYNLISKTTHTNFAPINKQVQIFTDYCKANKDAIEEGSLDKLNDAKIEYNNKFAFSLKALVAKADEDTRKAIVAHLQYITVLTGNDQDENLRHKLVAAKQQAKANVPIEGIAAPGSKEEAIFSNIFNVVQTNFGNRENTDLSSAYQEITSGNFVQQVLGNTDPSSLDLNALLKGAFGMISKVKGMQDADPQTAGMLNMVESMLSNAQSQVNLGQLGGGQ